MNKKGKKLVKNTAILGFGTLCTKGLMFIMTPLLIRWLSQNEYGTFDLLLTYVTLLIPFITLDIGEATFRFLASVEEDNNYSKEGVFSSSILVAIVGFIISIIMIVIISIVYTPIKEYLGLFILLFLCEAINSFITFVVRGLKKLPIYAISNILFVLSMCIFSFILIYCLKMGLKGLLISYSIGYLISDLIMAIKINIFSLFSIKKIDYKLLKDMLKYSVPLMPNAISWWIVNVSDRTIITNFLGAETNAIYAVSNKIPNLCQTFFNVFHLSWQENAIETLKDKERDKYYTSVFNNMIVIISSICIVILSLNFLFFNILFTKEYFFGYFIVPILIMSIIFSVLSQFIGGIQNARMESKKNGATTIVAAIINIIINLSLINYIGLYAAAISTLISYIALFLIRYIDISRFIKLKINKKSVIVFLILLFYFAIAYLNNNIVNCIGLCLSMVLFIIINNDYLNFFIKKILKKK